MKKITVIALLILSLAHVSAQEIIEIVYNGTKATVSVPETVSDVTPTVNGANVIITSNTTSKEYTYLVKGNSTDGSLTINGSYKLTLQLAGVTLTNAHGGAAIDVECGKRIAVELTEGTVNTLSDAALGGQKAALYFKGHAEFEGAGTLNVTGKMKHAISAKEYIEIKKSTGFINILGAVGDGIHCGKGKPTNESNYFLMKGGIINITNVQDDGVDSDDYGVIQIEGGAISVNIGSDATGLKADSIVTIKGGNVNIAVKGDDSKGIRANYAVNILDGETTIIVEGDGSKGIKAKRYETNSTVLNGGSLNIGGGRLNVQCIGGNINTETENGTEITKCVAVSVDTDLQQTAGDVDITAMGIDALGCTVDGIESHNGGSFNIRRIPWQIKTSDCQYDMSVYVAVNANNVRLTDYSDLAVGAFIGEECMGYAVFSEENYGVIRVKSINESAQPVTFKLYSYDDAEEYTLTSSTAVTFKPNTAVGEPSDPVVLSYTPHIDINGDADNNSQVNAADIVEVVNAMTGKPSSKYRKKLADANQDEIVNIADIVQIVSIILSTK